MRRVAVAEQPEQHQRARHDGRVDLGHHGPAEGHHQHRRDELVHRRARVACAVHPHGRALAVLRKPACDIGRAHGERAPGQADEQADHEKMPVLRGIGHEPDGRHGGGHHAGHDDAPAVAVRPDAQRHAHQRAREHGHGHEQAELGGVEVQHLLDRDADDAEHHPDHEADREGQGADDQHRPGLAHFLRAIARSQRSICHGDDSSQR